MQTREIQSDNEGIGLCPQKFIKTERRIRCPRLFGAGLVAILWFSIVTALAHSPYERNAGSFRRDDGVTVSIVRYYQDGIFGADPVSVRFRLPDGSELARTSFVFDAAVRPVSLGIEVYQFTGTWLPIANRVEIFDGHELKNITTNRRWASPLFHFTGDWVAYVITISFALLLAVSFRRVGMRPKHGGVLWFAAWDLWAFVLVEDCTPLMCSYLSLSRHPLSSAWPPFFSVAFMLFVKGERS